MKSIFTASLFILIGLTQIASATEECDSQIVSKACYCVPFAMDLSGQPLHDTAYYVRLKVLNSIGKVETSDLTMTSNLKSCQEEIDRRSFCQ
jgi:hypothetical protein